MALIFTLPGGITVKADSASEAAALARQLMPTPVIHAPPPKPVNVTIQPATGQMSVNGIPPAIEAPISPVVLTRAFLHAIRKSGSAGADTDAIALAVQVTNVKGIGSRAAKVNEYLRSQGFELDAVYRTSRNPDGGSIWTAGPRLDAAIDCVEEAIGAHKS